MLTIQEASQLTGKSEKTIRRLIKHLLEIDKNAIKRIQQAPYPGGFTYKIDKEYLLSHTQSPSQSSTHEPIHGQPQVIQSSTQLDSQLLKSKDETIAILKTEIDRLHEEIRELLERDKERNILFHKFQDALMLEAPKHRVDVSSLAIQDSVKQDVQQARQREQSKQQISDINHEQIEEKDKQKVLKPTHKQPQKSKSKKQEQTKKKGFLSFLRRK